jgi:DNA-binding SARP family transcriptional activator
MNGNNITYRQQNSFCSKPACRKCREGIGHGPYWYAYQVVNGRTVRTYIGKTLPPGVQLEESTSPTAIRTSPSPAAIVAVFRLTTLGQMRLESRGADEAWQIVVEASWRLPHARELFGCLLCVPNRRLTQLQACELVWPHLDTKGAAQNLRSASIALGKLLGNAYVRQASNVLSLAPQEQLWVDFEAFEELISQARSLPGRAKAERIALLEQAVKLYNGDFLPEETTAAWCQERRQSLRRQWVNGVLTLVDLYLDEQRAVTSIDLLDQILAAQPTNEAAVQRLMFVLARQQRRVEAVQAYQRLAGILLDTHQTTPAAETQTLFQAIQQGNEAFFRPLSRAFTDNDSDESSSSGTENELAGHEQDRTEPLIAGEKRGDLEHAQREIEPASTEILIGRINQSPLVGRDHELILLYQLLAQVEAQREKPETVGNNAQFIFQDSHDVLRAHYLVLMGEAGIGKTRLAEESAREARRRGWTVVWSHAYPQEQGIPYRLWTAALRNVLAYNPELARQVAEFAPPTTYFPLRALVPEMQEALIGVGVKADVEATAYELLSPDQEELRLREAMYTFLTTLSFVSPLLIILDDIQWTDNSSALMLGYLARRMAGCPIVLLATCRETELAAHRVLSDLIAHMQREQAVEVMRVQPLSDEHIEVLVSSLSSLPRPTIAHIQNQAAGNPFFAEELAYALHTNAAPEPFVGTSTQDTTPVLPGTIAAALDQRIKRLSDKCQNLLGKAAVLGGSFDFDLIAAMEADKNRDDSDVVLDLLDEALHSGVLTEEGSGAHVTYHFWHPLLASHLYNGLSATRRARLHRRIAEVLHQIHQTHESDEAATITQHLIRGGAESARIAHYAELAGHHAYSLFAYPEAERYYRVALKHLAPVLLDAQEMAPVLPENTQEERLHLAFLIERLAECTRIQGNFQQARNFYTRVLQLRTMPPRVFMDLADERQEAQIQAMLWNEIAWIWRYTGDTAAARQCNLLGEEVLRNANILDGPAWGCLTHQQASLYWLEGYHEEAVQAAHRALDLFTNWMAQSAKHPSQQSLPLVRQTRTTRSLLGDPVDLGRVHGFLGSIYTATGHLSEALTQLNEALAIYEQYERRREYAHACCNIGHIYLLKAEYEQGRYFFQRALDYAEQSRDIPLKSVLLYNLAELAAAAHQFAEAEGSFREALALATQINDREYLSTWHTILGAMYQEQGRFKEAATVILRGLTIGRAMPSQPCIGFALIELANLRRALVENEQSADNRRGQRVLQHAQNDLQRALRQQGLGAEWRTRAHLAQAEVSRVLGDLSLAKQQGELAYADAKKYELKAIQIRCQQLLETLSPIL